MQRFSIPALAFLFLALAPFSQAATYGSGAFYQTAPDPAQTQQQNPGAAPSALQGYPSTPAYLPEKVEGTHRSFTGLPAWMQRGIFATEYLAYPPFGANLFQGHFSATYYDGMNESYLIAPGDRILIHIWGAHNYSDTSVVDQQGNIFLPEIGPMLVAGTRNGDLQRRVKEHISSSFKTNVEAYANLLTAQPVAVYVTGFVARPGRYAGGMTDSVLYYLDRAGGILPERGTYRDITVQRRNRTIARVDLYEFILSGTVDSTPLRDGDVIVVGPKGNSINAGGIIPQQAAYESKGAVFTGAELARLAAPLPAVSHVSISGTRAALPFHQYLPLAGFADYRLAAGDQVAFLADQPGETILVAISGSTLGATRYPVKRNTTLRTLLSYVPVDVSLSNLSGIYVKRKSVAEQQRRAIADSLRRLEASILTTSSATGETASIRVQEAQLVQNFVQRVSALEPDGVVVVTKNDLVADITLEDGDEIVIPQRSDIILISGEVLMPKAVVYAEGQNAYRYVQEAGGFTSRADQKNILVVHPNGELVKAGDTRILPGDMLLVLPEQESKGIPILKDIMQVLYQIAVATRVVLAI